MKRGWSYGCEALGCSRGLGPHWRFVGFTRRFLVFTQGSMRDADGAFTGALVPRWRSTGFTRCLLGFTQRLKKDAERRKPLAKYAKTQRKNPLRSLLSALRAGKRKPRVREENVDQAKVLPGKPGPRPKCALERRKPLAKYAKTQRKNLCVFFFPLCVPVKRKPLAEGAKT